MNKIYDAFINNPRDAGFLLCFIIAVSIICKVIYEVLKDDNKECSNNVKKDV